MTNSGRKIRVAPINHVLTRKIKISGVITRLEPQSIWLHPSEFCSRRIKSFAFNATINLTPRRKKSILWFKPFGTFLKCFSTFEYRTTVLRSLQSFVLVFVSFLLLSLQTPPFLYLLLFLLLSFLLLLLLRLYLFRLMFVIPLFILHLSIMRRFFLPMLLMSLVTNKFKNAIANARYFTSSFHANINVTWT